MGKQVFGYNRTHGSHNGSLTLKTTLTHLLQMQMQRHPNQTNTGGSWAGYRSQASAPSVFLPQRHPAATWRPYEATGGWDGYRVEPHSQDTSRQSTSRQGEIDTIADEPQMPDLVDVPQRPFDGITESFLNTMLLGAAMRNNRAQRNSIPDQNPNRASLMARLSAMPRNTGFPPRQM